MTLGRIPRVFPGRPWHLFYRSTVVGEAVRFRQHAAAQSWPIAQRRTFTFSAECLKRVNVTVPPMAESINEGTLASFSGKVGDSVEADEELATVETDKIDVPINSPEAGVVVEYLVEEGNKVSVGQKVAVTEARCGNAQAETQVKDDPPELNPSLSAVVGNAEPSHNAAAPKLSGERVVSIRNHLELSRVFFFFFFFFFFYIHIGNI